MSSVDGCVAAFAPRSLRPRNGHDIPGYSGHVPGVRSGNIYGKSFREQNAYATKGEDAGEPIPRPPTRTASAPVQLVPGYAGASR